nr:NAD(P)H-hydrate dehydratase [Candidatus Baldrarchaeota archaeon]
MENVGRKISSVEMAIIDENSEWLGVPRLLLMENAGKAVATEISKRINVNGKKVVILAGLGNNGGDSFVAARHLAPLGASVFVFLLGKSKDIRTDEARRNWETLKKMFLTVKTIEIRYVEELKKYESEIKSADIVIDGMLGTGVRGELRDPYRTAVEIFNKASGLRVAVDIPTGLNPDTGEIHGVAVKADLTVTFHALKKGLDGKREYTGDVVVANIGVPPEAEVIVGPGDLRAAVKPRRPEAKKGDFGRVLIVGGSNLYTGAPALCAMAALRCGCDLSIIVAPESVASSIRSFSPNIIVHTYSGNAFTLNAFTTVIPLVEKCDTIVIGPGLGTMDETFEACLKLFEIVKEKGKALVVDADGLKALSTSPTILAGARAVLTPHAGEFKGLVNLDITKLPFKERIKEVKKAAKQLNLTILLKGHWDIISDGNKVKVNITGNPAMTVGGTGDVLSGLVATLLAWKNEPFTAASVAAFINGVAGDLTAQEKGYHIVATDLVDKIPEVFKKFEIN